MEDFDMPNIYQTVLINFGDTIYLGDSVVEAKEKAVRAGFESQILLDGALVASWSPISGWKHYQ